MTSVDVVVVSFNSAAHLRECVEPFVPAPDVNVVVVDNASSDASLDAIVDLPVRAVRLGRNGGFAHGCNVGWRLGRAPFVLFLNPDARIDLDAVERLAEILERNEQVGIAAPRIERQNGNLDFSQRRFPRLRSTYARALFLHRLFPRATWSDEVVRDPLAYERPSSPEWVSGACLLMRRSLLEELDGWDETFFFYCEDIDLCQRVRNAGYDIRFEPSVIAFHQGGASAPRVTLRPVLTQSRVQYSQKYSGRLASALERGGLALEALTHVVLSRGGLQARASHARSLKPSLSRSPRSQRKRAGENLIP